MNTQVLEIVSLSIDNFFEMKKLTTQLTKSVISLETKNLLFNKFGVKFLDDSGIVTFDKYVDFINNLAYQEPDIKYENIKDVPRWYFERYIEERKEKFHYDQFSCDDIELTLLLLDRAIQFNCIEDELINHFIFYTSGGNEWETEEQFENSLILLDYIIDDIGHLDKLVNYSYDIPSEYYYKDETLKNYAKDIEARFTCADMYYGP